MQLQRIQSTSNRATSMWTCMYSVVVFSVVEVCDFVCVRVAMCGLEFCMTISIDNKIETRWKWKPKTIHRVWCAKVCAFILIGRLALLPTMPHPINTEINDHTLKLHVLAVTKFSNVFHTGEFETEAVATASHTKKQLHQFSSWKLQTSR